MSDRDSRRPGSGAYREDKFTHTVEDAAKYERLRDEGERPYDQPSRAEAESDER